jgi:hypothetical protein
MLGSPASSAKRLSFSVNFISTSQKRTDTIAGARHVLAKRRLKNIKRKKGCGKYQLCLNAQ